MIAFGKHHGKSIEAVFSSDLSYCKWLYSNNEILNRNPDIKSFLDEQMKGVCLDYTMSWGKHKNMTIQWIHENDNDYFYFIWESPYSTKNCKKLKEELLRARHEKTN